nr:helix-turn-helix domain-containing protein [Amycolatopsis arida]
MAARVLASLYATDAGSLTAAELVGRLRVSPASISKAVGYLEELGLVRRERDTLRRRERYVIDDDVWMRAWEVSTRATVAWADVAHEGAEAFGTDTPAGARLKDMHAFFDELARDMVQVADHWQRFRATRQAR